MRFAVGCLAVLAVLPLEASAQVRVPANAWQPLDPPPAAAFKARRDRVMDGIGSGVAVLIGAPAPTRDERFVQENNFFYLTGAEAQGAILLLDAATRSEHLFLPVLNAQQRQWEGARLEPGAEASRVTGIANVHPRTAFDSIFRAVLARAPSIWVMQTPPEIPPASPADAAQAWATVARDPWLRDTHANAQFAAAVREARADVKIENLSPAVLRLRTIKDSYEQEYMRRTGLLGALGVAEAIRSTRPGYTEWEIAASATFVQDGLGATMSGFSPVIASGPNTNTMHHLARNRRTVDDDVILLDYGSNYGHYTSDVTRTWSASGRFTPEQLAYYETVRMIRDSVLAAMRPGVTLGTLRDIGARVATARGHADVSWSVQGRYLGHPVGMSAHDPGSLADSTRLAPGMVWNLEPVIDVPARGWHFRIEDGVLITETGIEVLTNAVPVDPAAIERLYREVGVLEWWKEREQAANVPRAPEPSQHPGPRADHSMTYDAERRQVIMFGGSAGDAASLASTWGWDGAAWTRLATTGPGARDDVRLAYDAARKVVVLYGGRARTPAGVQTFTDTWEWDGSTWRQVAVSGPEARTHSAMGYDPSSRRILLFGGSGAANEVFHDTWAWDGAAWTRVAAEGPEGRYTNGTAELDGRLMLSLVYNAPSTTRDGNMGHELWQWSGTGWQSWMQGTPRFSPMMPISPTGNLGQLLLYAGYDAPAGASATSWMITAGAAVRASDAQPGRRKGAAMAYDKHRQRVVLYGGESDTDMLNDTWEWSGGAWHRR